MNFVLDNLQNLQLQLLDLVDVDFAMAYLFKDGFHFERVDILVL